ncbi:hypothetical protein KBB42_00555 [Candidatus Dojkabacteria bacterium]|nr:hypothetical protein [Candidatus Dojkabacteria bacterium]
MEEKEIIEKLNSFKPKPSTQWQEDTLDKLNTAVTKSLDIRNSNTNLSNLFNSLIMKTKFKAVVTIATIAVAFIALSGVAYASNSAMPGDPLFGVDKAMEQIRRVLTVDPLQKSEFEMRVMDERMEELKQMSYEENSNGISQGIQEVEAQQLRLQNMFEEMTKLRAEGNGEEAGDQLGVMNKIAEKLQEQSGVLNQVRERLNENGDESNSGELNQFQNQYQEQVQNQINQFENETGLKVETNTQTSEQNQGEESQIQNQIQNEVNTGEGSDNSQGVQGVQNSDGGTNGNGGR